MFTKSFGAKISLEIDLVKVGHNETVEMSTLRGFGVDNGTMIFGQVQVGTDANLGGRSVVAPGNPIPHISDQSRRDMRMVAMKQVATASLCKAEVCQDLA